MVNNMCSPEQVDFMSEPVIPVPGEISADKQRNPHQDRRLYVKNAVTLIEVIIDKEKQACDKRVEQPFGNPYIHICYRIGKIENIFTTSFSYKKFQDHQPDKKRDCECQVIEMHNVLDSLSLRGAKLCKNMPND